jgi:hypothetical protein
MWKLGGLQGLLSTTKHHVEVTSIRPCYFSCFCPCFLYLLFSLFFFCVIVTFFGLPFLHVIEQKCYDLSFAAPASPRQRSPLPLSLFKSLSMSLSMSMFLPLSFPMSLHVLALVLAPFLLPIFCPCLSPFPWPCPCPFC